MCAVTIERSLNRLRVRCTLTHCDSLHEVETLEDSDILVDTWLKFHPPTQTQHTHMCAHDMTFSFTPPSYLYHTLTPYFAIFLMRSFELLSFFLSRGI